MKKLFLLLVLCFISIGSFAQTPHNTPQLPPELVMSEEEMNQMLEFLSTLDEKELEELEKIGRQVLTDMGLNPDTLEPLSPAAAPVVPTPPATEVPKVSDEVTKVPVNPQTILDITALIKKLTEQVMSAQEQLFFTYDKTSSLPAREELQDLLYYLKVLHHKPLIERLSLPAYTKLINNLRILSDQLERYPFTKPVITQPQSMDPYAVLELSPSASEEEIKQAFEQRANKLNVEQLKQQFEEAQLPEKDQKRLLKEAQLSLSLLKDAYETLQDPLTRERLNRERETLRILSQEQRDQLKIQQERFAQFFHKVVYEKQISGDIEKFLQEFEPEQLKIKKMHDEAEAQRRKEQAAKITPTKTPGGPYEKPVRRPDLRPTPPPYIPFGGKDISSSGAKLSPTQPQETKPEKKPLGDKGPTKKPGDKEKKEASKDKDKKDKPKDGSKSSKAVKRDGDKKTYKKSAQQLLKDVNEKTPKLRESLQKQEAKINELAAWTHTPTETESASAALDVTPFNQALDLVIQESNPVELRDSLKELRDKLKEKKLSTMEQKDIDAWKNYYQSFAPFFEQVNKAFDAVTKPEKLNPQAIALLQLVGEPRGPVGIVAEDIKKITKYIQAIHKIVVPEKEVAKK